MESVKVEKSRNWRFLLYPESLPENWLTLWNELDVRRALSPVHDRDLKDGCTPTDPDPYKKAHYHGVFCFDGPVTAEYVSKILRPFNAPEKVLKCSSVPMALRYFCHMDNPEKAEYSASGVMSFGIDFDELTRLEKDDITALDDIITWIDSVGMVYFSVLFRYAMKHKPEWKSVIIRYTHFLKEYLKSFKYELDNGFDGNEFVKSNGFQNIIENLDEGDLTNED